jgi:histidine ammonia-lyase
MSIEISGKSFSIDQIKNFLAGEKVVLAGEAQARIARCRAFVEGKLRSGRPYYGINTGFGNMANCQIPDDKLIELQENLLLSHAVGVGEPFSDEISRLMMLFRANVLAIGHSGICESTMGLLIGMINAGIAPVVPSKGSVGASGDLAPLAHLALPLIGHGEVRFEGKVMPSRDALKKAGLAPVRLSAKEGLALINGTQAITAVSASAHLKMINLMKAADVVGALSVEGDLASATPFDERIHRLRPHPGQLATANNLRRLIEASCIVADHKDCSRVQDPYSFRCIPQVHGAVKDAAAYSRGVVLRETGSCTDNPLVFDEDGDILSGGNFHGEPLALAMDLLAIAAAELGSISERRVAHLTMPLAQEIPTKNLVNDPGLNSGLMPPHVTMSALVSENKALAHPASVDSIPTFGGQEDHVSMGPIAARKAMAVIENCELILAIELFAACQAIDLQATHGTPGKGTKAVHNLVRKTVKTVARDREYRFDIDRCIGLIRGGDVVERAEEVAGELCI